MRESKRGVEKVRGEKERSQSGSGGDRATQYTLK